MRKKIEKMYIFALSCWILFSLLELFNIPNSVPRTISFILFGILLAIRIVMFIYEKQKNKRTERAKSGVMDTQEDSKIDG